MADFIKINTIVELLGIVKCIRKKCELGDVNYSLRNTLEITVNSIYKLCEGLKSENIKDLPKYLEESKKAIQNVNNKKIESSCNVSLPPSCYDDFDEWPNKFKPLNLTSTTPTSTTIISTSSFESQKKFNNISKYGRKRKSVKRYGY